MAQPSASPTPNVLKPPLSASPPALLSNSLFHPRKEFLRDQQRVFSSFSLLTLAGTGLVRLYSFPDSVINALRKLFETLTDIGSCRESAANHFFEFSLESKPWANVKTLASEKLIVAILSVVYQFGFSFLSTIEYAREADDRIALAFSRPTNAPLNPPIPAVPSGSASTLPQSSPMLFAISFPSTAILRVIDPPLPLTPGILQAVRNAWPRGIAYEKKIGDSYEFKLRGYKWFQENTFAVDSLQQILSLLAALDRHSFTLLTSLTIGNRSRTRDLWIFIGPPGESHSLESPPSSPTSSSLELKREITPQHGLVVGGVYRPTSPPFSSPLKQVTPTSSNNSSKLKKPFPPVKLPNAFTSESSLHAKAASEVGSVDMTGVGTHRRAESHSNTPDVFYTTGPVQPGNVYQRDFNPWNRGGNAPPIEATPSSRPPPSAFGRTHSRHYSMSSTDDPLLRSVNVDSPYDPARPGSMSSSSTNSRARRASSPLASTPLTMQPPVVHITPSSDVSSVQSSFPFFTNGNGQAPKADGEPLRTPTPPLLGSGAFRDSAFSSSTGWRSTTEVPIAWTGKDPEPSNGDDPHPVSSSLPRVTPFGPRERRPSSGGRTDGQVVQAPVQPPLERRGSSGPPLPGAWASTPQEEKDDVVGHGPSLSVTTSSSTSPPNPNMIPPTITEHPSQEGDEVTVQLNGSVRVMQPKQHRAQGDGARKSEAAVLGNTEDKTALASIMPSHNGSANGSAHPPPYSSSGLPPSGKRRANSISEGWVIINVDSKGKDGLRPGALKHQRSQSDSRIPTVNALAQTTTGGSKSTMSPAAKAIVMVDAIGEKERQREKQSGSRLKKLLGRSVDKSEKANGSGASTPQQAASPTPNGSTVGGSLRRARHASQQASLRK
ncbi:uncharacterized protein BXZ73DRAFT_39827 [Epithele typhae]|uniref:uncharacterized protein n=1 Tax=Epithele typhae TaxID=378194 RepID=UPI002008BD27|nr:uncharacterized protein BXZ73DRAFT_39827 [Epithele typhae]KAH9944459.1 hypothetical protein BXZ73DRAFT_39827 [Epithele typhae]